jgi:CTP:molybdopterin cytidylyltransferase MocA
MSNAAIILAAGASRRMGSPKPLLDWGGEPLVIAEIRTLEEAGIDYVVVVLGARAQQVRTELGVMGARTIFNAQWPQGRSTSLVAGARALLERAETPQAVVIQNVDQPTRADIVTRLLEERAHGDDAAVQPEFEGHGGHPVIMTGALLPELAAVEEATLGLRAILEAHPPRRIPFDDPLVRIDLDTPEDLERSRAQIEAAR